MAKTPVIYDPNILQAYVETLYREARWIILMTTLKYAAATFAVSWFIYIVVVATRLVDHNAAESLSLGMLILTAVAAMIGVEAGRRKAWELKFRAQQLLLQMQIEQNTAARFTAHV